MTLFRTGTYGEVNIPWQIGYQSGQGPASSTLGSFTPATGTVTIPHGVEKKDFNVTVCYLIYRKIKANNHYIITVIETQQFSSFKSLLFSILILYKTKWFKIFDHEHFSYCCCCSYSKVL